MKKQFNILKYTLVVIFVFPLILSWFPWTWFNGLFPKALQDEGYVPILFNSVKELSITLVSTMIFAMLISYLLGFVSVLSLKVGRFFSNILNAIESIPSILTFH